MTAILASSTSYAQYWGDNTPFCFQAINSAPVKRSDGKGTYTRNQAILLPAGASDAMLLDAFNELDMLNRKGYDIYFVVNRLRADYKLTPLNIGGRVIYQHKGGDADICGINALHPDFDEKVSGTFDAIIELSPTANVETSEGNFQAYWRLDGEIPVHQFSAYQAALRARFAKYKPDRSVNNPSRLMRLPGFRHIKAKKDLSQQRLRLKAALFQRYTYAATG
ncbi:DNA-primase RepB domain-containing protein [Alishewanella longhuensis]